MGDGCYGAFLVQAPGKLGLVRAAFNTTVEFLNGHQIFAEFRESLSV
jgi:hypothetical protein